MLTSDSQQSEFVVQTWLQVISPSIVKLSFPPKHDFHSSFPFPPYNTLTPTPTTSPNSWDFKILAISASKCHLLARKLTKSLTPPCWLAPRRQPTILVMETSALEDWASENDWGAKETTSRDHYSMFTPTKKSTPIVIMFEMSSRGRKPCSDWP
jgi:hypothetical protein